MKKIIFMLCLGMQMSCAYDNFEDLYGESSCPPGGISFSSTIAPIVNSNCALSGCHASGGQLPTLETYAQISANSTKIKNKTSNGTMPPPSSGMSLTTEEIEAITCWVDTGAQDN